MIDLAVQDLLSRLQDTDQAPRPMQAQASIVQRESVRASIP
jgi:hypothetical protein